MTEQSGGNVYEMLWDCEFCGTKKLLGKTHRFCPSCGAPQNPDWRYFPSDSEKVAVKDHIYVGADKTCPSCGVACAANAVHCGRCGSPLEGAETVKLHGERIKPEGEHFETEDLYARQDREKAALSGQPPPPPRPKTRSQFRFSFSPKPKFNARLGKDLLGKGWDQEARDWRKTQRRAPAPSSYSRPSININTNLLIGLGVVAVIVVLLALFWKKEISVAVVDHRWEREIAIERMSAVSDSSSCSSMPADAYDVDRRYEQVDTRQVPDGQECYTRQVDQGDGTFREDRVCETRYRSEPVYGYVCYYKINRWREVRSVQAEGGLHDPVHWPDTHITTMGTCVGCERTGDRDERYLLILETDDGGKTYECPLDEPDWRATEVGATFTLKVGVITNSPSCGSLELAGQTSDEEE